MSEFGTERLEPTARVAEQLDNEPPQPPASRRRRPPPASVPRDREPADDSETPAHQVDSLF